MWELNNFNCATRQTAQVRYDLNVKCHVDMFPLKTNDCFGIEGFKERTWGSLWHLKCEINESIS